MWAYWGAHLRMEMPCKAWVEVGMHIEMCGLLPSGYLEPLHQACASADFIQPCLA